MREIFPPQNRIQRNKEDKFSLSTVSSIISVTRENLRFIFLDNIDLSMTISKTFLKHALRNPLQVAKFIFILHIIREF